MDRTVMRHWHVDGRQLLYLGLSGVAIFLLLPRIVGIQRVGGLLNNTNHLFLIPALMAETIRYLASAGSTRTLARLFDQKVPFVPLVLAFFAGSAANRVFSTGGAPGMIVRLVFLTRQGLSAGSVAAIFLLEDIIGLFIGGLVLATSVVTLTTAQAYSTMVTDAVIVFLVASLLLVLTFLLLYRRRMWVERGVHGLARGANRLTEWWLGRTTYVPARVQHSLDEFYRGLSAARRSPMPVVVSFILNALRYAAGALVVYFAFLAIHYTVAPGVLILIFTSASVLSTVSAVPGEMAFMGSGLAILSLAFGVPVDVAALALILSRTLAFWLPIPAGLAAFWLLRRWHQL